jgi:hypothetical protein
MQESQKGLQTIQQECDEVREALAETNTKLKATETSYYTYAYDDLYILRNDSIIICSQI